MLVGYWDPRGDLPGALLWVLFESQLQKGVEDLGCLISVLFSPGRRIWICIVEETLSGHFYAFLDYCITTPTQKYDFMKRLVSSTICHRQECDKVPLCELFYMCAPLDGGSSSLSFRPCYLHVWGMLPMPIRELSTTTFGKIHVFTKESGHPWRVPKDDIIELTPQVKLEVEPTFVRRQRPKNVDPDHP
ncbi:unnamed protein product [Lactuca saligna]|uniref:Uncharacterized protein n=1 Tax=Lactuca saligna TaxID=75948 RepID=A0AA35VAV9_LACSI|nr:unnamed protein product [Lactuca saligna]